MKKSLIWLALSSVFTLSACGGGGGGGSNDGGSQDTKALNGIYFGSMYRDDNGDEYLTFMMMLDGRIVGVAADYYEAPLFKGSFSASDGEVSGRGTGYLQDGAFGGSMGAKDLTHILRRYVRHQSEFFATTSPI